MSRTKRTYVGGDRKSPGKFYCKTIVLLKTSACIFSVMNQKRGKIFISALLYSRYFRFLQSQNTGYFRFLHLLCNSVFQFSFGGLKPLDFNYISIKRKKRYYMDRTIRSKLRATISIKVQFIHKIKLLS